MGGGLNLVPKSVAAFISVGSSEEFHLYMRPYGNRRRSGFWSPSSV